MAGYLVLARKYRPRTFADVIGQEVVTRVLVGAIEEGRIGHAYLFSGPRGTGKTTTARILARCLNCVRGPTADPCGECEHCLGIEDGSDPDLIEIDAATHTGVDHIRELREQAAYAPMRARTKVYIIDEVHMLSKAAFNALLKTLEEPPPHVCFLFATTELHKVIATVVSRCQVLKLAPLAESAIAARLEAIFDKENVKPGPGVVQEIARGARGGMRDALSLADKLLALAGGEPTLDDLRRLGGHTGARELEDLLAMVEAGDKAGVLRALPDHEGGESELVAGLLGHLRLSLLAAYCGTDSPLLPAGEEERAPVLERAKRLDGPRVELWMQELLHARERMRTFPGQERIVLELTLLDLARPETTVPVEELAARVEALDAGGGSSDAAASAAPSSQAAPPAQREIPRPEAAPAASPDRRPLSPREIWNAFLEKLAEAHGGLAQLLRRHGHLTIDGDRAEIRCERLGPSEREIVTAKRNQSACARVLAEVAGRPIELAPFRLDEGEKTDGPAATPPGETPRPKDEFTAEVADLFGGVVEDLP